MKKIILVFLFIFLLGKHFPAEAELLHMMRSCLQPAKIKFGFQPTPRITTEATTIGNVMLAMPSARAARNPKFTAKPTSTILEDRGERHV